MFMKKIILFGLLPLITTMGMAQNRAYIGGGISMDMVDIDGINKDFDNGISGEAVIGIVTDNKFGGEFKISNSIVSSEVSDDGDSLEVDTRVISLLGTYSHQLTNDLVIMPKIGFSNIKAKGTLHEYGGSESISSSETKLTFGVDAKYRISSDANIYAGYTIYNVDDGDFSQLVMGYQQSFNTDLFD